MVDGSTIQLPDTPRNQKRYPQPTSQKPGCGFPVIRFVALLSLNSGAILQAVWDSLHSHDLRLFRRLWQSLRAGDIILGDRAFGEYSTLAQLPWQGVDVVARLHHQRKVDFREAESAKVAGLLDLLDPLMEEGHKVLVFSQFVTMLDLLRDTVKLRQWPHFYLAGDTENRGELVKEFQSAKGGAVFLISLKAGGFGLNLPPPPMWCCLIRGGIRRWKTRPLIALIASARRER